MTVPETVHERPPPPAATRAQAPDVHAPPQHCEAEVHASPICLQYDVAVLHTPLMQPFEQHSRSALAWVIPAPPQVLPDALQRPALFVTQVPVHLPLQHSLAFAHATARFLHAPARQVPAEPQELEQQSVLAVQGVSWPVSMHGPLRLPHWFGE
jgi:hypothetical protein